MAAVVAAGCGSSITQTLKVFESNAFLFSATQPAV
jgi:hypothetical protein